jgi:hypothetical protein
MSVGRYVAVDQATRTILGGPWGWDGVQPWVPPEPRGNTADASEMVAAGTLMVEADAQARGYAYPPPPPPPVQPWVLADTASQVIVGGPWEWDGQSDPAPAQPAEGQQLMPEQDALSANYTYPQP